MTTKRHYLGGACPILKRAGQLNGERVTLSADGAAISEVRTTANVSRVTCCFCMHEIDPTGRLRMAYFDAERLAYHKEKRAEREREAAGLGFTDEVAGF